MDKIISGIGEFLSQLGDVIIKVLPKSPFVYLDMNPAVAEVMGYVNYFVPISTCVAIAEVWLVSIGLYYVYMIVLRWVKAIQ